MTKISLNKCFEEIGVYFNVVDTCSSLNYVEFIFVSQLNSGFAYFSVGYGSKLTSGVFYTDNEKFIKISEDIFKKSEQKDFMRQFRYKHPEYFL